MQLFRVFGAAFIHISLGRMGNQLTAENRTVYAVVCDVNMTFCNIVVSVKTNVDLQRARRYETILPYSSG